MYSEEVLAHFKDPKNVGVIENPDGKGKAGGDPKCPEDLAYIWIRVEDGLIEDVKHKTQGCPFAIASSSVTTEMVKGKSLEEAIQIDREVVAKTLGEIPARKLDSIVAPQALKKAVSDYQSRQSDEKRNQKEN